MAYSKEFKKEVVDYALATSYSKAAEKYGVGKGSITRWVKKNKNRTEQKNGTEQVKKKYLLLIKKYLMKSKMLNSLKNSVFFVCIM